MTFSSVLAANTTAGGGGNIMNYILFALFALLIIMMIRKSRKTKAAAAEKASKLAPGVDVMTNFGLFGHVKAIDNDENKVSLEVSPGVVVDVHLQTVAKIIEPKDESLGDVSAAVPDDASSLTNEGGLAKETGKGFAGETAEETLARLNKENSKDN